MRVASSRSFSPRWDVGTAGNAPTPIPDFSNTHSKRDREDRPGLDSRRRAVGAPLATLALLVVGLLAGRCWAGAWVQERGSYFLKVGSSYFSTTEEFNHLGDRLQILEEQTAFEDASFRDANVNLYLEYGLTENATMVATLPFKGLRSERDVLFGGGIETTREIVNTVGFGDITLSVRRQLLPDPLAFSIQTGVKFPLGYDQRPANDGPPLGSARFDGEIHLLAGRSLWPLTGYVTGSLGFRRRGGRLHDEVVYGVEVGYNLGPVLTKIALDGVRNRSTPPDIAGQTVVTPLPGGGGVLPNLIVGDQHFTKLSPGVIYSLSPGMAVQAELLHVLAGTNTLSGTIFSLALILNGTQ